MCFKALRPLRPLCPLLDLNTWVHGFGTVRLWYGPAYYKVIIKSIPLQLGDPKSYLRKVFFESLHRLLRPPVFSWATKGPLNASLKSRARVVFRSGTILDKVECSVVQIFLKIGDARGA
jgi:hypothetical protein